MINRKKIKKSINSEIVKMSSQKSVCYILNIFCMDIIWDRRFLDFFQLQNYTKYFGVVLFELENYTKFFGIV